MTGPNTKRPESSAGDPSAAPTLLRRTATITNELPLAGQGGGAVPAPRRGPREIYNRWAWTYRASPEALWPLVSNTERFNRDAAVPFIQVLNQGEVVNARQHLKMHRLALGPLKLIPIEWVEEPFEWLYPHHFGVVRNYIGGPIAQMRVSCTLTAAAGGTELVYETWVRPRGLFGWAATHAQMAMSHYYFGRAFRHYDNAIIERAPVQLELKGEALAAGGRERLRQARARLAGQAVHADALDRLFTLIERGDPMTLARLRPYALADAWGIPRRAVLSLCLLATRAGVLDLSWQLLCPLCRGAKDQRDSLSDLPGRVHCEVCHIDFDLNFEQSVEMTFRPNPGIRPIDDVAYCVGGPQVTPHILLQQLLEPGEHAAYDIALDEGRYRVRSLSKRGGQYVQVRPGGAPELAVQAPAAEWQTFEAALSPSAHIVLQNMTDEEQLLVLEHLHWSDQAVVAADVTTLQMFRDLFSREALRPNTQIEVGSLTLVFTDLRGSSRLYRDIGDAPAFGVVMDHFDVLREVIAEQDGAIVKTIGDAVMAVFRRPVNAVRAVLIAQDRLAQATDRRQPLELKAGIHAGPSIAVNLNDRLDYFGTTVNLAARLADLCGPHEVVISAQVAADPEVRALAEQRDLSMSVTAFETLIRGFGDTVFTLYRVRHHALDQWETATLNPAAAHTSDEAPSADAKPPAAASAALSTAQMRAAGAQRGSRL